MEFRALPLEFLNQRVAFLTSSQVVLMLLVWGPHWNPSVMNADTSNECLLITKRSTKSNLTNYLWNKLKGNKHLEKLFCTFTPFKISLCWYTYLYRNSYLGFIFSSKCHDRALIFDFSPLPPICCLCWPQLPSLCVP